VIYPKKPRKDFILIIFVVAVVASFNIIAFYCVSAKNDNSQIVLKKHFAQKIEHLIARDFKNIFQSNLDATDFIIIKNFILKDREIGAEKVYISNNILSLEKNYKHIMVDISNISKMLDAFAEDVFLYSISINDNIIFSNNQEVLIDQEPLTIHLGDNYLMKIKVQHYDNSSFVIQDKLRTSSHVFIILAISIAFICACSFVILYFYRQKRELVKSRISLNNAIIFLKQNKKFILRCYQYSKSQTSSKLQDYFPLSIISEKPNNQVHVLILESVINEIQNYFDVYREFYQINSKIEFISDFNVIKSVLSEDEMHQLLISMIYNVLYFNKNNAKIQNIALEIQEDRIIIFSSGVKLNQKYAIQASEMIFYESVNPYLLKLGQILVLLTRHGIECEIVPESNGTSISIIFAESIASSLQKDNVVINFKQRKHKK
tara:strand:+ start:391 stop:1686 length:1296 start_codon:yes stop_codon:yes gene_type:complete